MAESAWLADLQRTVYPHKLSLVSCRSSAGQGHGQRPMFYHFTTQPTEREGQTDRRTDRINIACQHYRADAR